MSGTSTRAWGAALAVGIVAISSLAVSGSVRSQDAPVPGGLALVDQTFAVVPRSLAHFEFVVIADVPEIVGADHQHDDHHDEHDHDDDHHHPAGRRRHPRPTAASSPASRHRRRPPFHAHRSKTWPR